jgi:hypothetical protein
MKTMVSQVPIPLNNQTEGIKDKMNNMDQKGAFSKMSMSNFMIVS